MQYGQRIEKLQELLGRQGLDALALLPGPNLFYLTGLSFHLMERPVIGIFAANGERRLLIPELERAKAEAGAVELALVSYGEAAGAAQEALASGLAGWDLMVVGLEPLTMRYFELQLLRSAMPKSEFMDASELLAALRMTKNDWEIEQMQKAVQIAETAFEATLPLSKVGMTERDLASELTLQLLRAGSEPETPFGPIVASGPNAALPHAVPSDRELRAGDTLIIDWGATHNHYISDITRTLAIGDLDQELIAAHALVEQANRAGRNAVRAGATCDEIDQAARQVIEGAGYGEYFIHRVGHGIGLEAHEPPNVRAGDQTVLEPGMTFTVEPGIYLPERGGVRIEDNVVVTPEGARSLTNLPRQLRRVA